MNPEICKKCKRTLVFVDAYELFHKQTFFCCRDLKNEDFDNGTLNAATFKLNRGKWKRFNFSVYQYIYLKLSVGRWIDRLLKKYDIGLLKYYVEDYRCPYYLEHEIYDWNRKS